MTTKGLRLGLGLELRLGLMLGLGLWLGVGSAKVEVGIIYFGGPRKSDIVINKAHDP